MMDVEAQEFFETEICGRWSRWKPTATERADWVYYLKPHGYAMAAEVVREVKAQSKVATSPVLGEFIAAITQRLEQERQAAKAQAGDDGGRRQALPVTYLVVTDPGMPAVARVGTIRSMVALDRQGRPIDAEQTQRRLAAAHAYARRWWVERGCEPGKCREWGMTPARWAATVDMAEARRISDEVRMGVGGCWGV